MGLRDILFGRKKMPASRPDRVGAVTGAQLTLETSLRVTPTGRAGLAVQSLEASAFERARSDIEEMLRLAGHDLGTVTRTVRDDYGYTWLVLEDPDFTDLVACVQVAATGLTEEGFKDTLLCALFPFVDERRQLLYLVFGFKRGTFYAFAPRAGNTRDGALELRTHAMLEREVPLEKDLQYRYPLWGAPVD